VKRLLIRPSGATRSDSCGSKAATLARALEAGLPVPPFVVVSAETYHQHAARAGVRATEPAVAATAIRSTALAFDLGMALTAALRRLGPTVAVRPSVVGEDLSGIPAAGLHEALLGVDTETVDDAVLDCWASLWSERAVAYREHTGSPHAGAAMAVIVQRMVEPALGGAAHTADRASGRPDIVVERSLEGAEPGREVFARREIVREVADTTPPVDPDDIPRSVAHLALAAEELLECPVDIDWAFADGALWLLQVQPIAGGVGRTAPARGPAPAPPVEPGGSETPTDAEDGALFEPAAQEPGSGEVTHAPRLLGRLFERLRGR